jgi:predicted transcriptional regulator
VATSIKIGEDTKDRLEQLQAEIKLETGRKVTQQELLDRIVAREFESKAALLDSFRDEWEGLSATEIEAWLAGPTPSADSGDPSLGDHDEQIYGEDYLAKKLGIDDEDG